MMSKTHITVGIAASLAVCGPSTIGGVLASIAGGAIGGVLCDIECKSTPEMRDALYGRLIAAGIAGGMLALDAKHVAEIWLSFRRRLSRKMALFVQGAANPYRVEV